MKSRNGREEKRREECESKERIHHCLRIKEKRERMNKKEVFKLAKGFRGRAKNCIRIARERVEKALQYSYRDRRNKKRDMRSLWIQRINAGTRQHGVSLLFSLISLFDSFCICLCLCCLLHHSLSTSLSALMLALSLSLPFLSKKLFRSSLFLSYSCGFESSA